MKRPKHIPGFADIPTGRTKMPELQMEERRLNFKEVETGFTEEMARREAARCLSCRRCIGCGLCLAECEKCAVVYDEQAGEAAIRADAVIFAPDAADFPAGRKRDLGYSDCADVVTSPELDRLLAEDGPFGGLVVRPFDGEVPRRVAFIQCVGSRDDSIGANYCSAECCSRTIRQATRLREAIGDAEVTVFHRGMRPSGKAGETELENLEAQAWSTLVEGIVTSVREDPATGAVVVGFVAGGKEAEAGFDLVVLAVGIQAKRDFRRYARIGGVAVDKYGFVEAGVVAQVSCRDGVAFAGTIRGPQPAGRAIVDAAAAATRALGPIDGAETGGWTAAVIGGGAAGLAAASELLRRGVKTVIIDKSDSIGGALRQVPVVGGGDPKIVSDFVKSIETHPNARLIKRGQLASFERGPGRKIGLTVSTEAGPETIEVGALVIAAGAGPYIPGDWRCASDPVITQEQLAGALAGGPVPWRKVVMIQCVGARDEAHPYCSRFCCRAALGNALALKRGQPGIEVTILHKGIRVFGAEEELYADALELGVAFVEIDGAPTMEEADPLKVHGRKIGGGSFRLDCDIVVLSVAASDTGEVKKIAEIAGAGVDDLGFVLISDPLGNPFATGAKGVFACGFARSPVTVEEALADGTGAAGGVCRYLEGWQSAGDSDTQEEART